MNSLKKLNTEKEKAIKNNSDGFLLIKIKKISVLIT